MSSRFVSDIREIRNHSNFPITVRNLENPGNTDHGLGDFQPGESRTLEIRIPWCDGFNFNQHHIEVVRGARTFSFWQAMRPQDLDQMRVRVLANGTFDAAAPEARS
jgi:hypothetical protein